jgi:hypothetical protein
MSFIFFVKRLTDGFDIQPQILSDVVSQIIPFGKMGGFI